MSDVAVAIPNLLHTYAELIDAGDFAGAAQLFRHGHVVSEGQTFSDEAAITGMWRSWMRLYDGKPLTRHLITNPIITLASNGRTATCRSQYTVLQNTGTGALQPIITGRHHDRFERRGLEWWFVERIYAEIDLIGDLDGHLVRPLAERGA